MFFFIIIAGFILPWVLGIYLYKQAPKLFFTIAPITALTAVTCNQAGSHMGLWKVHHMPTVVLFDSILLDFGIFTIAGVWFSYLLCYKKKNPVLLLVLFISGMAAIEYISLLLNIVDYNESWSFFYTALMYVAGFIILHMTTNKLEKLGVFP
ncbi:hypothetical protein [Halobacillus andaensis]|uniref:hypothetical protein n=1 Tax=Halobacillus andaensis TaxID=1176239 RepID=UPI003D7643E9